MRRSRQPELQLETIPEIQSLETLDSRLAQITGAASDFAAQRPLNAIDGTGLEERIDYDSSNPLHAEALRDGLAHGITRRGAAAINPIEKALLNQWAPRSEKLFADGCLNILKAYYRMPLNDIEGRNRAMNRFLGLSSAADNTDEVMATQVQAIKQQTFQDLASQTIENKKGNERDIRIAQLQELATRHFGQPLSFVRQQPATKPLATVTRLKSADAPAVEVVDELPPSDDDAKAGLQRGTYRAVFLATTFATSVATLSTPAAAQETAHVQTVDAMQQDTILSGQPVSLAAPTSVNLGGRTLRAGVDSSVSDLTESYAESISLASPDVAPVADLIFDSPKQGVAANTATRNSAPSLLSSTVLDAGVEAQPLPAPDLTSAELSRLAQQSLADYQSALIKHMQAKGEVEATPSPNSMVSVVTRQVNSIDGKKYQNDPATTEALGLAYVMAAFPHSQKYMQSDPVLADLLVKVLGNAHYQYALSTFSGADEYRQLLLDSQPDDLGSYNTSWIKAIATTLSIAETNADMATEDYVNLNADPINGSVDDVALDNSDHAQHHHKRGHHKQAHHDAPPAHHESHNPPSHYNSGNFRKAWNFFRNDKDLHLSPAGTAALLGNFAVESGDTMNPQIVQGFHYSKNLPPSIFNKAGYGLNQATSIDRQKHLKRVGNRMHLPDGTMAVQLQFIKEELKGYPDLLHALRHGKHHKINHLAFRVRAEYERPSAHADAERQRRARAIYKANFEPHHAGKVKSVAGNKGMARSIVHKAVDALVAWPNNETDWGNTNPRIMKYTQGRAESWCSDFTTNRLKAAGVNIGNVPLVSALYNQLVHRPDFYVMTKGTVNSGHAVKPGDVIFYNHHESLGSLQHYGSGNHVGLVKEVRSDGTIVSVDGNWDDGVRLHYTSRHDPIFMAVGRFTGGGHHGGGGHASSPKSHSSQHADHNNGPKKHSGKKHSKPDKAPASNPTPTPAPTSNDGATPNGMDILSTPVPSGDTTAAPVDNSLIIQSPSSPDTTDSSGNNGNHYGNDQSDGNSGDHGHKTNKMADFGKKIIGFIG